MEFPKNYYRNNSKSRQIAISKDGGDTWINQRFDLQLPEPRCQGALLIVQKGDNNLLSFTNPANEDSRLNMTLSISYDDGFTWDNKIII